MKHYLLMQYKTLC